MLLLVRTYQEEPVYSLTKVVFVSLYLNHLLVTPIEVDMIHYGLTTGFPEMVKYESSLCI